MQWNSLNIFKLETILKEIAFLLCIFSSYNVVNLCVCVVQLAFEVLEGLLREDDEVVGVWYLMGWLHYLTKDADSARFYLEQMQTVCKAIFGHVAVGVAVGVTIMAMKKLL